VRNIFAGSHTEHRRGWILDYWVVERIITRSAGLFLFRVRVWSLELEARMCHNCMRDNMYNTLSIDQSIFLQLFLVPSCHCVTLVLHHLQCMRERSERLSCIWILQDFEKLLVGGGGFFFFFFGFWTFFCNRDLS
jgi:hypothetical protein